ncbi:hypothetical protein BC941DRAFT_398061 [Chlamydoabsidia padenii]|nr:hypothetical protein BC941DRAFT_398061 [Chlamydoabsidia padenii]
MENYKRHSYHFQQEDNQYPSQSEFDNIVQTYLGNLSFKKRDKALIDRQRYNLILQVLQEPKNTSVSTAQFRFWVKKMFQLVSFQTGRLVVCHDNKPVAVREQIYTILIWAHRQSHHGGRDKTSALVRQRFSWIPKELIARFVRHCPFCITRRNGQTDIFSYQMKASLPNMYQSSSSSSSSAASSPTSTTKGDQPVSDIHPSLSSSTSSSNQTENQQQLPSFTPAKPTSSDMYINQGTSYLQSDPFPTIDYQRFMRHSLDNYEYMNPSRSSFLAASNCDYGSKQLQPSIPFVNQPGLMPFF